ncbi:PQQ-binding-like beta-propeller repeat protein [Natranaeroarchaeum aerophilus]|uniref:PQQ-binding-like beta-propeller repeat protein n=1 Tax=Natranaeroarchaeum aerophilus TaxID=2917711 RepID=A0AAE3FNY7_9EURY|nr:PQQ-binding-like beta-propeller repeat protein [Natranaeroarchaeum aerophilus]MCL9812465.1 PQQ-binding-like beta-propeller repeat protein [Natranaeroarchaeum aerophilus]
MDRRTFLGAATGSFAVGTAGCFGLFSSHDGVALLDTDLANSGWQPSASPPDDVTVVDWLSNTWGQVTQPVVNDGIAYLVSGLRKSQLHAFDVETGDRRWTTELDSYSIEGPIGVTGEHVFAANERGVHAFDRETGEEMWVQGGGYVQGDSQTGVAVTGDVVYAVLSPGPEDPHLFAIDPDTGEERCAREIDGRSPPIVRDGRLYLASRETLYALDTETGETIWALDSDSDIEAVTPAVGPKRVYAVHEEGLIAVDATTGEREWEQSGAYQSSSPALDGDRLYVGVGEGDTGDRSPGLVALDRSSGTIEWQFASDTGAGLLTPVVDDGTVYVAGTDFRLYALDSTTGDRRWVRPTQWTVGTPAIADGTVLASVGGRLLSFSEDGPDALAGHPELDPDADPPAPEYMNHEFYFGTEGYEVAATATAEVVQDEEPPFDATFDVVDEEGQVAIEFTLATTGETTVSLTPTGFRGFAWPFGAIEVQDESTDSTIRLWSDAYESGDNRWDMEPPERPEVTVEPGESATGAYRLTPASHGIQPGRYARELESIPINTGADSHRWLLNVDFELDIEQVAPDTGSPVFDLVVADETDAPAEFDGYLSVEPLEPITDSHPGLVEVTLTGGPEEYGAAAHRSVPWGAYVGRGSDGSRLVLFPADIYAPAHVHAETEGEDGWWRPGFLTYMDKRYGPGGRSVDPAERFSRRYVVVSHPENDGPPSPGSYVFECGYADLDTEFTWGFVLSLVEA